MMDKADKSFRELLAMAARAEQISQETYARISDRLRNPLLKERFAFLVGEERRHEDLVRDFYGSIYPGEEMDLPETVDPELLPSIDLQPSTTLVQLLTQAMNSERKASDFYDRLSRETEGQKTWLLSYLSKVEMSHYYLLKSEHDIALWYEDYAEQPIDKVVT